MAAQIHALRERHRQASPQDPSAQHADELRELARDVLRLCPHRQDPERFLSEKEGTAERLIALAGRIRAGT